MVLKDSRWRKEKNCLMPVPGFGLQGVRSPEDIGFWVEGRVKGLGFIGFGDNSRVQGYRV